MTMTGPDMSKAMPLRSWFQSACPLFSMMPLTERHETWGGQLLPSSILEPPPSVAATSLPMLQHYSTPDSEPAAEGMETGDWDLLFRAVLETLARVACGRTPPDGVALRLQTPGDVLGGCLEALEQLRRSVLLAEHQRMLLGGASTATGPT